MLKFYLKDNDFTVCTASSYLFNKVSLFLKLNGYEIVDNISDADIVFINTCGVWTELENKVYLYIQEIKEKYNNIDIGIFGCLANRSKKINSVVKYSIPTKKEHILDKLFGVTTSISEINDKDINVFTDNIKLHSIFGSNKKKYFLEINRGCIHNCSYCGIKQSIGYVKSKSLNNIIEECKYAINNGYNEIVLVSDDVGSYGYDIGSNFGQLFNKIAQLDGDYVINIIYTEPSELIKYFDVIKLNFYKVSEIICPIQSFSNRILKLMKRKYTVEDFLYLLKLMREYSPGIKVTNHIIYGYPTETWEDFKNNLNGAKLFDANLFNLYSYIPGTKKFNNKDLVTKDSLKKRIEILYKLHKLNPIIYDIANKYDE